MSKNQMSNWKPENADSGEESRRRRYFVVWGVGLLLLAAGAYFAVALRTLRPPAVATTGLDPAVTKLIASARQEVRGGPRSGAGWGKLGSVLMHYEFIAEARFAFDQAELHSPADPRWPYLQAILLMTHDAEAAVSKLERATELARDRPDMPRLRLAQLLVERGRGEAAEAHFRVLLRLTPDHPMALLGLARLDRSRGRLGESTNLLDRCLNNPHTAKGAHAVLAAVQRALGNAPAAEAAARRSAALPADRPWPDPYWDEAALYRVGKRAMIEDASALMDQGRMGESLQALAVITREYPDDEEGWYLMGWAFNQRQQAAEAERALREHLRLSLQSPKGRSQLAVALLSQKRYVEAIKVLETALQLKPTWRELHFNLGYACVQLARYDEAIGHFRDALAHDPNYAGTYTALADLLSRRGDRDEARNLLRQALELDPSDARARYLLQRMESVPQ